MKHNVLTLGGMAHVYCVHDRLQREVIDPEDVKKLGASLGIEFDARKHKIHNCACCSNLFVTDNDTPTLCNTCLGVPVFTPQAPISEPEGIFVW